MPRAFDSQKPQQEKPINCPTSIKRNYCIQITEELVSTKKILVTKAQNKHHHLIKKSCLVKDSSCSITFYD